ncbi:hypothetical protein EVAR_10308_1 [Eumeta japonica]|uniref:Uncharacterized protein n=1 Tax=Eumeta variegata TaxID=151549 RepID=A0A4C1TGU5_EUMVA|nr:hypothetical protein EVAR_10308_1 [Eumeta japonica]
MRHIIPAKDTYPITISMSANHIRGYDDVYAPSTSSMDFQSDLIRAPECTCLIQQYRRQQGYTGQVRKLLRQISAILTKNSMVAQPLLAEAELLIDFRYSLSSR